MLNPPNIASCCFLQHVTGLQHGVGFDNSALGGDADFLLVIGAVSAADNGILANLADEDPELGLDLRSRLFTIDDVVNADDRFVQEELRKLSENEIAMLIAKKPDSFAEKILSCISAGRRVLVKEEQTINSPFRRADCEKVTAQFFSVLRRAFEEDRLIIKGRNDDVFL